MLRVRTSTEQIAQFLLEMDVRQRGKIDLPMGRRQIADHLGLAIETVSRAFNAFYQKKIIEFWGSGTRRILKIRDKQRLQQLASGALEIEYWKPQNDRKLMNAPTAVTYNEACNVTGLGDGAKRAAPLVPSQAVF
jgi:hypothetical protein